MTVRSLRGLKSFFEPDSIAVAGVSSTPDKLGSIIFSNLVENRRKGLLKARLYALSPTLKVIGDNLVYPEIDSLPEVPDLLILAVPESATLGLIKASARAGVQAAIVVSSGYGEIGKHELERSMARIASRHGMRMLGPNTIGVVDTHTGVDSLFLRSTKQLPDGTQVVSMLRPLKGRVAVITQSGHLGQTVVEELAGRGIGVRALVGTGNQADVSIEDMIEYFGKDPDTEVIAVYMEGVSDGRKLMDAAYDASKKKPVVVFKVGKTEAGARAAVTHTASMVGNRQVYQAAFRQSGIVEAESLEEFVDYTVSLLMLTPPLGDRLAIITNAGGVGAMAADEASGVGLRVEPPSSSTAEALRREFEGSGFIVNSSLENPFDLTATCQTADFARATDVILSSGDYDIGLILPTHQTPAIGHDIATRLIQVVRGTGKSVCTCVIGRTEFADRINSELTSNEIPSFPTPERAVRALAAVRTYGVVRAGSARTIAIPNRPHRFRGKPAVLSRSEIGRLLRSCGIREPRSVIVRTVEDARHLHGLKFPVACKLLSEGLVHKTDFDGVALGITSATQVEECLARFREIAEENGLDFRGMMAQEMVRGGVELILGGTRDPTFGPVLAVGIGGIYTELIHEISVSVAPVTVVMAMAILSRPPLAQMLAGYRGGPEVSVDRLSRLVSRFSKLLIENPRIVQFEINPLIAKGKEIFAVDARGTSL